MFLRLHRLTPLAALILLVACATAPESTAPKPSPLSQGAQTSAATASISDAHSAAAIAAAKAPPLIAAARTEAQRHVDQALSAANDHAPARQHLPPAPLTPAQIVDPDRPVVGSRSLGTNRDGALYQGQPLAHTGDHHAIISRHRSRQTHYGTTELVAAIERAAALVAKTHGGAPLQVGNISRRQGGSIPWSNSHAAGRDADLAFYALDDQGQSVPTPDLIEFDDTGYAAEADLHFDIPRNWTLVEALLTDESINLHWLFVSEGLKDLLLTYAIEHQRDHTLITRAADILHQPTDAPPHADHLHIRIGCSRADRLAGCLDWGPQWDWYDWHDEALFARTRTLAEVIADPAQPPSLRRQALAFLHTIEAPYAPEIALFYGIPAEDPELVALAVELLADLPLRSRGGLHALSQRLDDRPDDPDIRHTLYDTLRRAQPTAAIDVAWQRYEDRTLSVDERALALEALAHRLDPLLIPRLIDALETEPSPRLRPLVARQLRRIAARSDGLDWSASPLSTRHALALANWRLWWDRTGPDRQPMLASLVTRKTGADWKEFDAVDDLIGLLQDGDDYAQYNLNLILSDWTGRWVPRDWENDGDAYRFWSRWWQRNRRRVIDDTPPAWKQALSP